VDRFGRRKPYQRFVVAHWLLNQNLKGTIQFIQREMMRNKRRRVQPSGRYERQAMAHTPSACSGFGRRSVCLSPHAPLTTQSCLLVV
jgi:hypothetical protein